jgi:glyoxylase-like metal-dependent hydrolase (beta-lactamase superfamily II)
MSWQEHSLWIRVNGVGHAFGRELGCDCGRCRTVNYDLAAPPERLSEFAGWADPPVRANTSASLLVGDADGRVAGHVLIDAGGGVVDGLSGLPIPGIENVSAVLLTHWHNDHVSGLTQLGESLRRSARARKQPFLKTPLYCTLPAYDALRDRGGLAVRPGALLPLSGDRPRGAVHRRSQTSRSAHHAPPRRSWAG